MRRWITPRRWTPRARRIVETALGGLGLAVCLIGTSVLLPTTMAQGREASPRPPAYSALDHVIGLASPMAVAWLPDGRMLVSEAGGAIRLVEDGRLRDEPWARVLTPVVDPTAGLMGLAIDPAFPSMPFVYVYYQRMEADGPHDVLVRIREVAGEGVVERTLLDIPTTLQAHRSGGMVHFGPAGLLYVVGNGALMPQRFGPDEDRPALLYRMTRDGAAPAGNPFVDEPDVDPRVFAYGLRDPGDFGWSARSGDLLVTDRDDAGRGHVRIIHAGDNVGAPRTRVPTSDGERPVEAAPFVFSDAGALAGLESYGGQRLPAARNDVFACVIEDGSLRHLFIDPTRERGNELNEEVLAHGCTSDLATGPDENLYFVDTAVGRIRVLRPESEVQR